jgi:hypothetical protein
MRLTVIAPKVIKANIKTHAKTGRRIERSIKFIEFLAFKFKKIITILLNNVKQYYLK